MTKLPPEDRADACETVVAGSVWYHAEMSEEDRLWEKVYLCDYQQTCLGALADRYEKIGMFLDIGVLLLSLGAVANWFNTFFPTATPTMGCIAAAMAAISLCWRPQQKAGELRRDSSEWIALMRGYDEAIHTETKKRRAEDVLKLDSRRNSLETRGTVPVCRRLQEKSLEQVEKRYGFDKTRSLISA